MSTEHDTTTGTSRLLVLHLLRLKGFAAEDSLVRSTGLGPEQVRGILQQAQSDGLVAERTGRISGWTLNAEGRTAHAQLLAAELEESAAQPAVERANAAFLELNEPFKQLCSRWQMRPDGSINDHSDEAYDATVVANLEPLHERVVALTSELGQVLPRFNRYPGAFANARRRLIAGDRQAFAAPLSESYHDAWMELHQDLLSTLGRDRSTADGH
ncbi:MarR family transcriptional regulator [Amycolatopsis thermoflava]|uniref:MarR family transcriptional regulator n=1 Tax=Amycolatopsis thermoflava TaxID=84480 RepID=UPI0036551C31